MQSRAPGWWVPCANLVLGVSRDDLEDLPHHAELAAYQRNLGELLCADIMTLEPFAVELGAQLRDAWALMLREKTKALPVADSVRHADLVRALYRAVQP